MNRTEALEAVAHAAWHVLDDGGESDDPAVYLVGKRDADKLSVALDALEAAGWDPHPPPPPDPPKRNGSLLACGDWTYHGVFPGQSVGQIGTCDNREHGRQIITKCNVSEPDDIYLARIGRVTDE